MPQLTLDGVTDQARTLVGRAGQTGARGVTLVLPGRARRTSARRGMGSVVDRARGVATGRQLARTFPASTRVAWRAGKVVGRVQGASAVAPYAARSWWASIVARMQLATTRPRFATWARWVPLAIAGTRIAARAQPAVQRQSRSTGGLSRARKPLQLPFRAGRASGSARITGAITAADAKSTRASTKAATRAATEAATKAATKAATEAVSKVATKASVATARTTRRGGWRSGRTVSQGPLQTTGRQMRQGWRWARTFTVGFAIGAIWAYLFTPRQGPGNQALREGARPTQTA
jgi:hypothetical protein